MKTLVKQTIAAFVLPVFCIVAVNLADDVTVATTPPVVVKTVPQAGAADVDATSGEIQITFSKEMQDGTWSWVMLSKESFPAIAGQPHYLPDHRTCVLGVHLKADTTYALWINSASAHNFKDTDNRPAVPYLLVFKTKP